MSEHVLDTVSVSNYSVLDFFCVLGTGPSLVLLIPSNHPMRDLCCYSHFTVEGTKAKKEFAQGHVWICFPFLRKKSPHDLPSPPLLLAPGVGGDGAHDMLVCLLQPGVFPVIRIASSCPVSPSRHLLGFGASAHGVTGPQPFHREAGSLRNSSPHRETLPWLLPGL